MISIFCMLTAKFATVQTEGTRTVNREIEYYNLDMIIYVGYRVKSRRGVEFRRWANSVLKQYLIKGYAVNERIRKQQIAELRQLVQVVGRAIQKLHRTSLSDLWWRGTLSQRRREGCHASLSCYQESFVQ